VLTTSNLAQAQKLDSLIQRQRVDTSGKMVSMDASYNRPFLSVGRKVKVALGGYLEANTLYSSQDGVSEGLSFQARRLSIFMSASIGKRIKFLSEIEFEEGGKEIGIEFAAVDIMFHPLANLRGGIIINPIGSFNQNHDGPKWEFVNRPDMATQLLPATWSNAGFGIFGKTYHRNWVFGYEAYLSNGFDNTIIDNEHNRTFLPASKANPKRFEESNNGLGLVTAKAVIKNRKIGELGISYMGGVYNKYEADGVTLDVKRRLDVFAIDFSTTIKKTKTTIVAEAAYIMVDVPSTYTQQFGNKQWGVFVDIVQPILKRKILKWENASLNLAFRVDYIDWNMGTLNETGVEMGETRLALTPGISFRPSPQTVLRLNYRYFWERDILDNPPSLGASWLFGVSTYF
jgi:hypothetical protein